MRKGILFLVTTSVATVMTVGTLFGCSTNAQNSQSANHGRRGYDARQTSRHTPAPTTTRQAAATPPAQAQTTQASQAAQVAQASQTQTVRTSPAPAPTSAVHVDPLDAAIIEAGNYLNGRIARGEKIAFVSAGQNFLAVAGYVIDGLIEKAVNDGAFFVVDRAQLDAIRLEQEFQTSGAVNDSTIQSIGRILGVRTIATVTITQIADEFRLGVRVLSIESAQIQGQFNRSIPSGRRINALAGAPAPTQATITTRPAVATTTTTTHVTPVQTVQPTAPAQPPIQGIMVPGGSLAEKLAWLTRSADSHNTYIVEVNADERISPHTFTFRGAINITIVIRGDNTNRTIRLSTHGTMFTIIRNVTLVLDNNITLHGHRGNNAPLVSVGQTFNSNGGIFKMRTGSTITGNINTSGSGGGVYIEGGGVFEMSGGTISGNSARNRGGGVVVGDRLTGATFTMTGGTISGNTASHGGGVSVIIDSRFTMRNGIITSNIARELGGGVFLDNSIFTKTGGVITGYADDPNNGNAVRDDDGIIARRGHAVYNHRGQIREHLRKETTAGQGVNLSSTLEYGRSGSSGAWDQ